MAAEELVNIMCSMHDSVMVLAPAGFTEVELFVQQHSHHLRVASLQTKGEGAHAPPPKPVLRINPKDEALRLSEALTELSVVLHEQGKHWHGGAVVVSRGDEHADWKLNGADGSTQWFHRLDKETLEQLIYTDELFDLLLGSQAGFDHLQQQLEAKWGDKVEPHFDARTGRVRVERANGGGEVPVTVVGRYRAKDFAWRWNFDDADVRRINAPEVQMPGYSALWRPEVLCDEGFAWTLASNLTMAVGARGLLRCPEEDGAVMLAVRGEL